MLRADAPTRLPPAPQEPPGTSPARHSTRALPGPCCTALAPHQPGQTLLICCSSDTRTLAPCLCFVGGNMETRNLFAQRGINNPQEARPSTSPRLGDFTKRSPGHYLLELVSRSRRQTLGPHSLEPALSAVGARQTQGSGRSVQPADSGSGCRGPTRHRLLAAESPRRRERSHLWQRELPGERWTPGGL